MSNDAQEALRRIFMERALTMQDPFNDYTYYIAEEMLKALSEAEVISVNESGYVVTDLLDENAKLRRQVAAARKVAAELKAASGSAYGQVVDEVRQSAGDWVNREMDKAASVK